MKQIFYIMLVLMLTASFVSNPPRRADGQPLHIAPVDSLTTSRAPAMADSDLTHQIDSLNRKAALLNKKTVEIRKGSAVLERATRRLLREVRKDREEPAQSVVVLTDTDTIYVPQKAIVVRDTTLDHKTWFGKFFAMNRRLAKQCKLHGLFKRKH